MSALLMTKRGGDGAVNFHTEITLENCKLWLTHSWRLHKLDQRKEVDRKVSKDSAWWANYRVRGFLDRQNLISCNEWPFKAPGTKLSQCTEDHLLFDKKLQYFPDRITALVCTIKHGPYAHFSLALRHDMTWHDLTPVCPFCLSVCLF